MSRSLVLPLLFAATVLALYYGLVLNPIALPFGPAPSAVLPTSLSEQYDALTLVYTDPVLGFSIRYPRGYPLETDDGQSALFYASGTDGNTETYFWAVINQTGITAKDLQDTALELGATLESSQSLGTASDPLFRLQYRLPPLPDGSGSRLIQGLRACAGYSLYLSASVPDSLANDASLADYALYTSRCGPDPDEESALGLSNNG